MTRWRSLRGNSPLLSGQSSSPLLTHTSCQRSPGPQMPASWNHLHKYTNTLTHSWGEHKMRLRLWNDEGRWLPFTDYLHTVASKFNMYIKLQARIRMSYSLRIMLDYSRRTKQFICIVCHWRTVYYKLQPYETFFSKRKTDSMQQILSPWDTFVIWAKCSFSPLGNLKWSYYCKVLQIWFNLYHNNHSMTLCL